MVSSAAHALVQIWSRNIPIPLAAQDPVHMWGLSIPTLEIRHQSRANSASYQQTIDHENQHCLGTGIAPSLDSGAIRKLTATRPN